MFALKNKKTGNLLYVQAESNDNAAYTCSISYYFVDSKWHDEIPWVVYNEEVAKTALLHYPEWYNASYESPCWGKLCSDNYEIVELIVKE
jgi:hypothetical protein